MNLASAKLFTAIYFQTGIQGVILTIETKVYDVFREQDR
jgi:hypothetical protein